MKVVIFPGGKGLVVGESLFLSLAMIEYMLPQITNETVIAKGTQDPYVSQAYLAALFK